MDLKLNVVIATINLSGLPKSKTKTIKPPINKPIASNPDNLDNGLYAGTPKTEDIEAILSIPEAETIKKIAKTCGIPPNNLVIHSC